jgi:hypothetical protein
MSSDSESTASSESEIAAEDVWDRKLDFLQKELIPALQATLTSWHPGIGDRISLSNFCKYVEKHSSCLR